jgi:nucleoside-diphosphate-sugar epimerase
MTSRPDTTILITGGAGYIGSALTTLLLNQGYYVRGLDNLSFGGAGFAAHFPYPNFEGLYGDICNENDVDQALQGVDAVVHLAAIVGDKACRQDRLVAIEVNKKASEMLCQKAIAQKVKRFVFASTCSNYGAMDPTVSVGDERGYVNETSPLFPLSHYAELKVEFENYLLSLGLADFAPTCLRFATAYGLSARQRFDLTLNEFTKELVMGRRLEVYGEQFWRPYCHVVDLARACQMVLEADFSRIAYQAFNVGDTQENYQKKTLVELILKELPGGRAQVEYVPREEDPRDYRVNCDKIKTQLGFSVTRRVPDGIKEIILGITSGQIANPDHPIYRNTW